MRCSSCDRCSFVLNCASSGNRCSKEVIQAENSWALHTLCRAFVEYPSNESLTLYEYHDANASARISVSAIARLSPLAALGGTMCAASPTRNNRPCCIG